ncbi:hypothetical protein D3C84_1244480 [compost metagenome]
MLNPLLNEFHSKLGWADCDAITNATLLLVHIFCTKFAINTIISVVIATTEFASTYHRRNLLERQYLAERASHMLL